MRRSPARLLLPALFVLAVALASFACGVVVTRFRVWPYAALDRFYERFVKTEAQKEAERRADDWRYRTILPEHTLNDIPSLISIRSQEDAARKRARLREFVWGGRPYPRARLPAAVERGVRHDQLSGVPNLRSVDRLRVPMDYGMDAVVYHLHPADANDRLLLYYGGHDEDFEKMRPHLAFFVARGYAVLAFAMPFDGENATPVVEVPGVGRMKFEDHNQLGYLEAPFRFFAEPVVVALNHAEGFGYGRVAMTGFSGGGWATTLCAALDERIGRSYPAAGSLPEVVRGRYDGRYDWGDFEQFEPTLYRTANTLELYVLGAAEPGRRQLQILNQFDWCCFFGVRHQVYEPHVRARLAEIGGGRFDVFLDTTQRYHRLTDRALERIAEDLED